MPVEVQMTFSSSMSEQEFFKWLRSRGVCYKDYKILSGKIHQLYSTIGIDDVNSLQRMVLLL